MVLSCSRPQRQFARAKGAVGGWRRLSQQHVHGQRVVLLSAIDDQADLRELEDEHGVEAQAAELGGGGDSCHGREAGEELVQVNLPQVVESSREQPARLSPARPAAASHAPVDEQLRPDHCNRVSQPRREPVGPRCPGAAGSRTIRTELSPGLPGLVRRRSFEIGDEVRLRAHGRTRRQLHCRHPREGFLPQQHNRLCPAAIGQADLVPTGLGRAIERAALGRGEESVDGRGGDAQP
eukprot:180994-Hanusia_phi.AAC.2